MTAALWVVVSLLAVDAAAILVLLLRCFVADTAAVSMANLGPLFVAAGVMTALVAFLLNLRRARSEDVLKAATDLLEKGYESLRPDEEAHGPTNRRLSWLTSARLIATAERLGKQIAEPSHRRIYSEKKEYWRSRLYELIFPSPPAGLPATFFADKPEHMSTFTNDDREPLSERSLAFLYRFIRWPDGADDPIGDVQSFSDEEIERMQSFGPRELGRLMADVRRLSRRAGGP